MKMELKKSEKGKILEHKLQLEQTVSHLSEEIENLSLKNQQLIEDLKSATFWTKYQEVLEELNQLKQEQEILVDFKYDDLKFMKKKDVPTLAIEKIQKPVVDATTLVHSDFSPQMPIHRPESLNLFKKQDFDEGKNMILINV